MGYGFVLGAPGPFTSLHGMPKPVEKITHLVDHCHYKNGLLNTCNEFSFCSMALYGELSTFHKPTWNDKACRKEGESPLSFMWTTVIEGTIINLLIFWGMALSWELLALPLACVECQSLKRGKRTFRLFPVHL